MRKRGFSTMNVLSAALKAIEERLHLSPWKEEEIISALEEPLPAGWSAVRDKDGDGIYYWCPTARISPTLTICHPPAICPMPILKDDS